MLELCLTILGMGIVTYVPRMLPLVILNEIKLPPRWHNFSLYSLRRPGCTDFPRHPDRNGQYSFRPGWLYSSIAIGLSAGKRGHGSVRRPRSSAYVAVISRLNNGKQASVDKFVQFPPYLEPMALMAPMLSIPAPFQIYTSFFKT